MSSAIQEARRRIEARWQNGSHELQVFKAVVLAILDEAEHTTDTVVRRRIEALTQPKQPYDEATIAYNSAIRDVLRILEEAEHNSAEAAQDSAAPPRIYMDPAFSDEWTFRASAADVEYVRRDLCKGDADD